ncbi:MAG: U32 family peptidase [Clostridia bacterium]|nr:U32 family peptidase [Clostridia bacterium]
MKKPELLAPAGDLNKLIYAVLYGADAVYIGGEQFSLRTASANFTPAEMKQGVEFAHRKGARVYVACNAVPHNDEIVFFPEYLENLVECGVDALIITDPGMFALTRKLAPDMEIHISTQASTVNYEACKFWHQMGAKRIVLGREVSLNEIAEIRSHIPDDLEIESFVHGAMCMAHSGRCLISDFLTGRSSNRGNCAQPCRWKYAVMEETRPGEYFPLEENGNGTFIFNSKDMCMIEHVPDLVRAGVNSFKIEGRVKTEFYVASVVQAYRNAIDACFEDLTYYSENIDKFTDEVNKVSHREYYTGFYYGYQGEKGQNYKNSSYIRDWELVAVVKGYDVAKKRLIVSERNKFHAGETVEILEAGKQPRTFTIGKMYNEKGEFILSAPHAEMHVEIECDHPVGPYSFIRRRAK